MGASSETGDNEIRSAVVAATVSGGRTSTSAAEDSGSYNYSES
jgi:hypothetical protein